MSTAAACRECEAPVIWVRTRTGKSMPLDADPDERGDFYVVEGDDGKLEGHHVRTYPGGSLPASEDRYTSHFATCTAPERFRRAR